MIKEFVKTEIDKFFLDKSSNHNLGYFKVYSRWKKDFKCFAEDIFRKWRASRSASSVHQLLDKGMSAAQEQCIIQELEKASTAHFDTAFNSFYKAIEASIKRYYIILVLLTFLFGVLIWQTTNILLVLTWINLWFAGCCLLGARILYLISSKVLVKKSYDFIVSFFVIRTILTGISLRLFII